MRIGIPMKSFDPTWGGPGTYTIELVNRLVRLGSGHEVVLRIENEPWPDVGRRVGEAVAAGEADRGIVCCWTGTGTSIAANRSQG